MGANWCSPEWSWAGGPPNEMKVIAVVTPRKACPEPVEGRGSTSRRNELDSRFRGNDGA